MYISTVQSSPSSANAALPPHPRLQTFCPFCIFSLCPLTIVSCSWLSFYASSLPPDSLMVLQWNAGGLRARSTELLHFLSSHPVDLICIQESNFNSSFSFRVPGFSALVLIAPTPGLAFSLVMPRMLAAVSSFSSDRAYLSMNFLPPFFLHSIPTLIIM